MEGPPTYDDPVPEQSSYTVDSYSAAATATMPDEPFHEREEDEGHVQRP